MGAAHLDGKGFKTEITQAEIPVLIDFWADWCGPCRMLAPVIEELWGELDGEIDICKVDVDEAGDIAEAYGIMSIPTMILFIGGEEKKRITGLRSKADLLGELQQYL